MCLVTNEGRAPARMAEPPLRLPRPPAASQQVAGEGAAGRGLGLRAGRRAARGPGRRPAAERAQPRLWLEAFQSLLSPPEQGKKERRKEGGEQGGDSLHGRFRRRRPRLAGSPAAERLPERRAGQGRVETGGGGLHSCLCVCPATGKEHVCLGCALGGAGSAPLCLFPEVGGTLARSGNVP